MIDHQQALSALIAHIKTGTGKQVILENQSAVLPPYPFCTYSIPSPYLPQRTDYIGDSMDEVVEMVVSLTWHSKNNTEALMLSQQTAMLLKTQGGRQKLGDAGLTVVRLEGYTNRDTFLTIDTERRYGFDVRLRTYAKTSQPLDDIASIEVGNTTIN